MQTIGFVGIGRIGTEISKHLLAAGYEVLGYRRSSTAETVTCRLASPYSSGAGLTFSFVVRGGDDKEAERNYRHAWQEAGGACLSAGGTITHQQGVGLLKVPFMTVEMGEAGVAALRAVKGALDPSNVLNPGKLIPP